MSFTPPYLLGPVFFRTGLRCSGGSHLERSGMPLHNAVGITKKSVTMKIKVQVSSVWAKGCMFEDCVCYLT